MATGLPWNVKGVDPRTRDAARAAARRAGMTLGEWLDSVIREEAADASNDDVDSAAQELEALGERLSRLNQSDMGAASVKSRAPREVDATPRAAMPEDKTAAALDSIARWIEKTEQRMSAAERITAERQERATSVVADAIKTIGSRIAEIERRDVPGPSGRPAASEPLTTPNAAVPQRNGRPVLSRESLAAAVSDIRLRQRDLDSERPSEPVVARNPVAEDMLSAMRQDLRDLGSKIGAVDTRTDSHAEVQDLRNDMSLLRNDVLKLARSNGTGQIEAAIRDLSTRLQQSNPASGFDALMRPLVRIENEVARLSDTSANPVYQRIEGELSHIAGKIDALATRGSDGRVLAAATRELSAIRDLVSDASGGQRIEEIAGKLSALSGDIAQVRDNQVKGRDIDTLRESIADMRKTMLANQAPPPDGGAIIGLSRQIEALSNRIEALPTVKTPESDPQIARLIQRLESKDFGRTDDGAALSNRIEALVIKLEDLAERTPARFENRIDTLTGKLELLAAQAEPSRATSGLERKIEGLAERLEALAGQAATPAGTSRLEKQIENIAAVLNGVSAQIAAPRTTPTLERQIEGMAARLESLADSNRLTQVVARPDGVPATIDMRPMEDMVRALSAKLDEAQQPDAGADTLLALEKQVGRLAEKLDALAVARADKGLETTLQGLVAHFQGLTSETSAAAERAAREAFVSEFQKADHRGAMGIASLNEAINGLKSNQDSTGHQTNTALDAVHETLERIVARLGALENDLAREPAPLAVERRPGVAPTPQTMQPVATSGLGTSGLAASALAGIERRVTANAWPQTGAPQAERRIAQPSMAQASMLDVPLEPGSGRPKPAQSPTEQGAAPAAATPAPQIGDAAAQGPASPGAGAPAGDLRNIIAAARRAAQTVKAEAGSGPTDVATPGRKASKVADGLKDTLDKRRKPILLGLAAIVLATGVTHLFSGQTPVIDQRVSVPLATEKTRIEAAPANPSAPPEPAREPAAAPAASLPKDQSSVLSPSLVGPAQAAAPFVRQIDTTATADASTFVPGAPASRTESAALPEPAPTSLPAVTGLKELPTTLGSPGLRKAALGGDARAVYELAVRAADGVGGPRDPKAAVKLFERAAGAGLAPAQFRLGNMFEKGVGTPRDVTLARLWYERAAEKGNAKAMHNLAVLYAEGATGKPDYAMAVEWFRKASEHGMRDSQFNLGVLLARGLGTEQNMTQSWTWFAVGAAQGDDDAAKKRDEVGIKLSSAELAAAKIAVSQWKPKSADPSANEVVSPAQGWDEQPGQTQKRPAKARNV